MLAKVVVWGNDRVQARERAVAALRGFDVEGLRCNRDFLIACLMDNAFARGDLHTRIYRGPQGGTCIAA